MDSPIIIGAGPNGLVAACYLARAGMKPLVLERRGEIGGGAVTGEIHPGFHVPTLSHEILLHRRIVREIDLARYGLQMLEPRAEACALGAAPLVFYDDPARTAEGVRTVAGARDAEAYPEFRRAIAAVADVIGATFEAPPPDVERPDGRDVWTLLRAGRQFRRLGKRDGYRLLRWGPMPIADLVAEWFENEQLRAAIAAPGLTGTMFGPRSAGSSLVLLMREAHRRLSGGRRLQAKGGPGAVTRALADAARASGAEIRTGLEVERIVVTRGRVAGVIAGGHRIDATRVVSAIDPKSTLLRLVESDELTPDFAGKIRNYRAWGAMTKVNLALSALPAFGVDPAALTGRVHIGADLDFLERAFDHAKYGEVSSAPWLEMTLPSILDPSLAPSGAHVASVYVHYTPYRLRQGDWGEARSRILAATIEAIDTRAPGFRDLVVAAQVIAPPDLESTYGLAGGHVFHGELALDQLFTMRPLLGHARYASPIPGLYLCGGGTHPGGFLAGASGRLAAKAVT